MRIYPFLATGNTGVWGANRQVGPSTHREEAITAFTSECPAGRLVVYDKAGEGD